MSKPDFNII